MMSGMTSERSDRLVVAAAHSPALGRAAGVDLHSGVSVAIHAAREVIEEFRPELVVFFGADHRRAFRAVVPAFAIALAATSRGDRGAPEGVYDVPKEETRSLAAAVLTHGVDVAVAHRAALDHAFGLTALDLFGGVDRYPTIPVFVNSASPPLPTYVRAAALGRAVGAALADRPERILFVGSGGLAHDLPGFYEPDDGVDRTEDELLAHNARLNAELRRPGFTVGPEWDGELLAGLSGADDDWLGTIGTDVAERAGNGANEALTWVAAWAAGGHPLSTLAYDYSAEFGGSGAGVVLSEWAASELYDGSAIGDTTIADTSIGDRSIGVRSIGDEEIRWARSS
jgi:2,3-dihydroxyphenylpropionate 1,2-dioxygenase